MVVVKVRSMYEVRSTNRIMTRPFSDLDLSSVYLSRVLKLTGESESSRVIEYGVCGEGCQLSVGGHGNRRSIPYRLHTARVQLLPLLLSPVRNCPLKCSGVRNTLYKIRLQSAHTSPFKHPSTYRLRIPSIYQQYTKVTHTAYPRTVDHRSSSQPDPRHLPEKNENRNAVVRETNLADPRVFEEISLDHDRLDRRIVCAGQIVHTYTVQSTPYGVLFYYVY